MSPCPVTAMRAIEAEEIELDHGSEPLLREHFGKSFRKYADVPGLCKVASVKDVEAQSWSLNPGRHVSVREQEDDAMSRSLTSEYTSVASGGLAKIALEENEPMAYGITYVCKLP